MPIHKMGFTKPVLERHERAQPTFVHWISKEVRHSPNRLLFGLRWEMFSQNDINIPSNGTIALQLRLGVRMTRGMCLISLRQCIKEKGCNLHNAIVAENVDDIIINIQYSDSDVTINKGDTLCYVNYSV